MEGGKRSLIASLFVPREQGYHFRKRAFFRRERDFGIFLGGGEGFHLNFSCWSWNWVKERYLGGGCNSESAVFSQVPTFFRWSRCARDLGRGEIGCVGLKKSLG